MEIYQLSDMQADVHDFLFNTIVNDPYLLVFKVQREFGLRFSEAARCDLWVFNEDNTIIVPALKGQPPRVLSVTPDWFTFLFEYYDIQEVYRWANNSTASNVFNRYYPKKLFLSTGKSLTTHFFRHLLVKEKYAAGWTTAQISAFLGEVNESNTAGYGSSIIYFS